MADIENAQSRRTLLSAFLAGIGAWAVDGTAPGRGARAADGDPVRLGKDNVATSPTAIANASLGSIALRVRARGRSSIALRARARRGGTGIHGESDHGTGVHGVSGTGTAIEGQTLSEDETGVGLHGIAPIAGTGVVGESRFGTGVSANSATGLAVSGANFSENQPAVRGWAQNGQTGVQGVSAPSDDTSIPTSRAGVGVFGLADSPGGIGVYARSVNGIALETEGRVKLSSTGVTTISQGEASITITPGFDISAESIFLCNLQGDPGADTVIRWVAKNPDGNSFTIRLTNPVGQATPVGWLVLG